MKHYGKTKPGGAGSRAATTSETGTKSGYVRIQLDMLPPEVAALEVMMNKTSSRTKKELLEHALTLLEWAIEETEQGKRVGAVESVGNRIEPLVFRPLRNVEKYAITHNQRAPKNEGAFTNDR